MRLTKWDRSKLGMCRRTNNRDILEEFIDSGFECAKVEEWKHKNAHVCANSINASIQVYRIGGVKAVIQQDEVYLIKEDKNDRCS